MSKTNDVASLCAVLPACLSAATAFAARAFEAVDDYPTMYVPEGYVPSPLDDGDGVGQLVVLAFCAVCGFVGMKLSLDSEQVKSEEALAEKVAKQVAAMRAAPSGPVPGTPVASLVEDAAAATTKFDNEGLLRLDGAVSPETAAALLAEVNATLARELGARGGNRRAPLRRVRERLLQGQRYDLKLPWAAPRKRRCGKARGTCVRFSKAPRGRKARLCEFAALVSDPGSARQPVHPDTNYRRDRCVVTSFVALQDVDRGDGADGVHPGEPRTASAHPGVPRGGRGGGRRSPRRTAWRRSTSGTPPSSTRACSTAAAGTSPTRDACSSTSRSRWRGRKTRTRRCRPSGTSSGGRSPSPISWARRRE